MKTIIGHELKTGKNIDVKYEIEGLDNDNTWDETPFNVDAWILRPITICAIMYNPFNIFDNGC